MTERDIDLLFVFGTRPEAIKLAPVIRQAQLRKELTSKICVTAQHREMLDSVLSVFKIEPDFDLDLMTHGQDLATLTSKVLTGVSKVIKDCRPKTVVVHGDTTTSMAAALAAHYHGTRVAHVEAGLRTYDLSNPWPEEANRQITARLANIHFAPTETAKTNLVGEKTSAEGIYVTGNTVVDALLSVTHRLKTDEAYRRVVQGRINKFLSEPTAEGRTILITGHRRESFGSGFRNICEAIRSLSIQNPDVQFVYPVHLNPSVKDPVHTILGDLSNVRLLPPIDYESFIYLLMESYLVLTDSGGIQEEAPELGKPVLVMRRTTERPEAISSGTARLVGTDKNSIVRHVQKLLDNPDQYREMSQAISPYGDGRAAIRIVDILAREAQSIRAHRTDG